VGNCARGIEVGLQVLRLWWKWEVVGGIESRQSR
jgi:hypothetical protein